MPLDNVTFDRLQQQTARFGNPPRRTAMVVRPVLIPGPVETATELFSVLPFGGSVRRRRIAVGIDEEYGAAQ